MSEENKEKLRTSDAENDDRLLNTVEDRLANLHEITKDADDQADELEEQDEPTPEEEDQAGEDDDEGDTTPEGEVESDTEDTEDDTLPAAFLRAAIHRGWKQEEAEEFFKENPKAALKTFQNCYMDVNNASREWARIGKAKQQSDNKAQIDAANARPETPEPIDVEKLIEKYDIDGDEAKAMREYQKLLKTQQPIEPAPMQQPVQQQADPNKLLEIENFFNSDSLNAYKKFYGNLELGQGWADLSAGQYDNRFAVLQQADLILMGAEASNQAMDPIEALERAHMIVSEPIREQAIRESIKGTAVKRKKSMTIRPSSGTRSTKKIASDAGSKPGTRSREQLTSDVGEKLHRLFSN